MAPYSVKSADGKYTGFIPDLLNLMAAAGGFSYKLFDLGDKVYGTKRSNGKWNGVVGAVLNAVSAHCHVLVDLIKKFYASIN